MLDCIENYFINLQLEKFGLVAEWLGSGLQNHVQRFESARDLKDGQLPVFI